MHQSRKFFSSFLSCIVTATLVLGLASEADAHARWRLDGLVKPRTNDTGLKEPGPCGAAVRTATPTILKSGDTVTVEFEETINHRGYFVISFSPAADQGFDQNVLVARVPEVRATRFYPQEITLPDVQCDDCTLQLIQVMEDRNPPTNYYSCADIVLTADGTPGGNAGDTTPPADVTGVSVAPGDAQATLEWINPAEDFFQVMILRADQPVVATPGPGLPYLVNDSLGNATVIYNGNNSSLVASQLLNGSPHHFKLYAYDESLNYAAGIDAMTTLAAAPANVAPGVSLIAEQATVVINKEIVTSQGPVIVQAFAADPNPNDQLEYDWSGTDSRLVDTDPADNTFTFEAAALDEDDYKVSLSVADNGNPALSTTSEVTFTVRAGNAGGTTPAPTVAASGSGGGTLSPWFLLTMLLGYVTRALVRRRA